MFKTKKYTLKFSKSYKYIDDYNWSEVTDGSLMAVLLKLQSKYNFEIVSVKFNNSLSDSYIKIKCNKEDKNKIFNEYCLTLNKYITNISF